MGPSSPDLRIGSYLVGEPLGEGGMGTVYRVVHAPTGAVRAMKVLREVDRTQALRFQREAEAMAAVGAHEHLLAVHEAGHEAGFAWFVMDLATGGDLADRLRRGRLAAPEVVRIGAAVARALAHLHARGLLHRDVKPSNVLFDERGTPLLADLGLVRRLDDSQTRLTESGTVVGTPAYMAPEQVTGRDEVDARTDVYALGMVLYEAATGRYPFDAGSGALELLAQIQRQTPASPRGLAPDLPPALEAVIMRCLEKDPARRFGSTSEVAEQLEAALAAPPEPPRVPGALGLGAAAILACVGVGLAVAALARSDPVAPSPGPPPTTEVTNGSVDPAALAAEVDASLGREDVAGASLALERALASGQELPPDALRAIFSLPDEDAARGWLERAGHRVDLLRALDDARALHGALTGRGPEAAATTARGAVEVARAARQVREAVSAWRVERYGDHPVVALPAYEALVAAAGGCASTGTGLAVRLWVQREVLAFDSALVRLANRARPDLADRLERLLRAARDLAPDTAAAYALTVVERWAASRRGRPDPDAPLLSRRLGGRYAMQEVTRLALEAVHPGGRADLNELDARLASFRAAWTLAQDLGLVDPEGVLAREVSYEAATRLELLLRVQERQVWLLSRRAFLLRGAADAARAWDEALAAATALDAYQGEDVEPLVVIHLARGDVERARATLRRVDKEPRRAQLDLELALLEGDLTRARALAPRVGDAQLGRCQRALLSALEGQDVTDALAALRAEETELSLIPWRGAEPTTQAIVAARGGWRPWTAKRPWP